MRAPLRLPRRAVLAGAGAAFTARPGKAAEAFDAEVRRRMAEAEIPGLGVGYAEAGRVRFARGYGLADLAAGRPVTAATPFHIASITKTVVAAAVVRLAQAGRLGLDEAVAPHLDFPAVNPRHPADPITFRHLLTHTSGVSDASYYRIDYRRSGADATLPLGDFLRDYLSPDGRVAREGGSFSDAPPGARWDYSNVGYALLGYAAGHAAGVDLRDDIARHVFGPLGARGAWTLAGSPGAAVSYEVADGVRRPAAPVGLPDWPAGALRCSIGGFMPYLAAVADGGGGVLTPSWTAAMLHMIRPAGLPDWLTGQGLGWQEAMLGGVARPNHWGGDPGVFTVAYLDPATRRGVAIFANLDGTPAARTAIKALAARLLSGGA